MKITEEQADAYLAGEASVCPVCGSVDIVGASMSSGGGHATQEMTCEKCDAEWEDVYELSAVEWQDDGEMHYRGKADE